jgi:anthranilate phosphoribosyltransferase
LARAVLAGEPGAIRDIVVANAAAGLWVGGAVDELAAGVELAAAAIDDGRASATLERLVQVSNAAVSGP